MTRIPADSEFPARVAEVLKAGGTAIIPTDTVYGIAAMPGAVEKLYAAKGRDEGKPIALLASSIEAVERFAGAPLGAAARRLAERGWPGALTLVVKSSLQWEGFRIPAHDGARKLCELCGGVLRVTSANKSGEGATANPAQISIEADIFVDGGICPGGTASTVAKVHPSGALQVLRKGPVAIAESHAYLLETEELVEVGHGSRRVCYRLGNSGFCVKFYKRPEDCVPGRMKKSILRDIAAKRFSKQRNSSSREVYVAHRFRHALPPGVTSHLPETIERVFHPVYGWGILETYYTNPDGSAIIPYEYELRRQMDRPDVRREIYIQARDLLLAMIAAGAPFYEPGNFHTLFHPDGTIETKLIDFEPDAKTLIPLEVVWPWFRRWKLRRKAKRYLASMRKRYHIDIPVETPIG